MKKLSIILVLIGTILASNSCSNEFDLVDTWKNIPVVYGMLSKQDTAHYIRIEKAFVDPTVGATEIAQRVDSLYYDNIKVELERLSTGDRFQMNRVNGTLEGYPRAEGELANNPNYLYKIRADVINLEGDESYRLIITDGNTDNIMTEATTQVVGDYEAVASQPSNPIFWRDLSSVNFAWRSDEKTAVFYDLRLRLNYLEQNPDNFNEFLPKSLLWEVEKDIERESDNPRTNVSVFSNDFYRFIQDNLDGSQNLTRQFRNIDVIVDAGAQDLFDYINIGQANTGITSSQTIPSYTNLTDGLGVFSSRNRMILEGYNINAETRDSLRDGRYTRHLNFQ